MESWSGRTAVVVDLDRLGQNVENIRRRLHPGVKLIAVVKADAYGHGAVGLYPAFRRAGVDAYAVAIWEEGAELRRAGVQEPIIVLGDIRENCVREAMPYRLDLTVFTCEMAEFMAAEARKKGIRQRVQIKIDTGMNRIGFSPSEASLQDIGRIMRMDGLDVQGIFTHFARADEADHQSARKQYDLFLRFVQQIRALEVPLPLLHVANSPAILMMEEVQMDAVRAGDILYGLPPSDEMNWPAEGLRQILSWYTYVVMVKEVPKGSEVGYGGTFVTPRTTRIATLPVGFADGLRRELSNRGKVLIHGMEAPIIGRICMDQCMVDVTDIPDVQRGDTVTLLGDRLSVQGMADMLHTNVDEIVCGISKRVPRFYKDTRRK